MLSDRKLRVLQAIINDFVMSAHPVGSRTISKKYLIGTSSATIRNEMADLEELGYLLQPHTSAGRIPSDLGYRYFVDSLMQLASIELRDLHRIHAALYNRQVEAGDAARRALRLLSELTGMTAVVAMPDLNKAKLENLRLVQVTASKLLMILVTDKEMVRTIELGNTDIPEERLDIIAAQMLAAFKGKSIEEMDLRAIRGIKERLGEIDYFLPALQQAFKALRTTQVYVEGASQLALHLSTRSPDFGRGLASFLSNSEAVEQTVRACLDAAPPGDLAFGIGSELENDVLEDCSIIAQQYDIDAESKGFVAIIGPKHMDYEHVCAVVQTIAKALSELFSGINL